MKEDRSILIGASLIVLTLTAAVGGVWFASNLKAAPPSILARTGHYTSTIERGMGFYTPQRLDQLRVDDYLLFQLVQKKKGRPIPSDLAKKFARDPAKRLIRKNDYFRDVTFSLNNFRTDDRTPIDNDFYVINEPYAAFLRDPWDDVLFKALYCDQSGYAADDFSILKSIGDGQGGYLDTHALLGMLLLKENRCTDQGAVTDEIGRIVLRIVAALEKDTVFSDLYAERIVFLYWAGYGESVKRRMG